MLEGSPLRPKVLNKLSCSWHQILPMLIVFENNGRFAWLLFSRRHWMLPFQKSDTNKNQMTVTCRANRTMWMNNAFYTNFSYVSVVSHRWNCVNNSQGRDNGIGALFHEEENILICFLQKKIRSFDKWKKKKRVIRGNKWCLLSL